jgi:hypothetical protein
LPSADSVWDLRFEAARTYQPSHLLHRRPSPWRLCGA